MSVVYGTDEPSGFAEMVGGLIDQNLQRDPSRARLLRDATITISVPDADVAVTVRTEPGRVAIRDGEDAHAHIAIRTNSERLLGLTAAPLRFGLPDVLDPAGRTIIRDVLSGRTRIRGLLAHPRRLARFSSLLSVTA